MQLMFMSHSLFDEAGVAGVIVSAEAACIGLLLPLQHLFDSQPSVPMSFYLAVSIVFESSKIRSQFGVLTGENSIMRASLVAIITKIALLLLHEKPKGPHLREEFQAHVRYQFTGGFWINTFPNWVDEFLHHRHERALDVDDIANLSPELRAQILVENFQHIWQQCKVNSDTNALIVLIDSFRPIFSKWVIENLCYYTSATTFSNNHGKIADDLS